MGNLKCFLRQNGEWVPSVKFGSKFAADMSVCYDPDAPIYIGPHRYGGCSGGNICNLGEIGCNSDKYCKGGLQCFSKGSVLFNDNIKNSTTIKQDRSQFDGAFRTTSRRDRTEKYTWNGLGWSASSYNMWNDYNGVCLSNSQVNRKFYTKAKEQELIRKRKRIARNVMRTARFKWRSQALKKKIARQKIRKMRLQNDYNTVANKFVTEIVSPKYK